MLVVVGGHSRNIGKTSVAAGLIAALPEARWHALKITQHGHNVCHDEGKACGCAPGDPLHRFALDEQTVADSTDTGRFLAAGAAGSWWLRTAQGDLGHALPALKRLFSRGGNWMVESNSLLRFYRPDLYLVVLDRSKADMKDSARRYLDRASALIYVDAGATGKNPPWQDVPRRFFVHKPEFTIVPPVYAGPALVSFVRSALLSELGSTAR